MKNVQTSSEIRNSAEVLFHLQFELVLEFSWISFIAVHTIPWFITPVRLQIRILQRISTGNIVHLRMGSFGQA